MINLKAAIKKKLNPTTISQLIIWQQRLLHFQYVGFKYQCPICHTYLNKFIPLPEIADGLFMRDLEIKGKHHKVQDYETLNIEQFLCAVCGAQDKARLYALFFQKMLPVFARKYKKTHQLRLVHFAPEGGLGEQLKQHSFIKYTSADLMRDDVDEKADLTNLHYKNNSIDLFICSHILEHIPDDERAIKELYRVLKRGGKGILMVPILLSLSKTYEDPAIKTEKQRLKHFGQADHVRVYSKKDFLHRLHKVGFKVKLYTSDQLGKDAFKKYAITPKSVLYVVEKE